MDFCWVQEGLDFSTRTPSLISSFLSPACLTIMGNESRHPSPARAGSHPSSEKETEQRRPSMPAETSDEEKSHIDIPVDPQGNHHPSMVPGPDGKRELREWECWDKLAYSWPKWKKAMYLASIAGIQISMNFNTSVYPSAVNPISEHFGISTQAARVGQMIYLVFYSFGCELWAPWSEEFGRWPILQLSMFLINIWEIPCSVAPNFGTIVVCRALVSFPSFFTTPSPDINRVVFLLPEVVSRLASSRTCTNPKRNTGLYVSSYCRLLLELVLAVSSVVRSSVVSHPSQSSPCIILTSSCLDLTWQWNFWIQLIFGAVVQAVHFWMPESRATILIDREAKRRRQTGEDPNVYGPNELKKPRISLKEAGKIWLRPFEMFVREPIVLFLSLLSGFSDALIFTFLEAFAITFPNNFGFGTLAVAWAFIPINASYFFTYFLYWPWFWRDDHLRKKNGPDWMTPERRLKPLLLLALFEPIGLFGFAWTCKATPCIISQNTS